MFYTYILQSTIDYSKTYIGFTQNLEDRLLFHNDGKSFHTSKHKPWKFAFYSAFNTKNKAIKFEKYLKSCSGRRFLEKHCL